MNKITAFEQFLFEFDVPLDILQDTEVIARSLTYSQNQTNLTSKVQDTLRDLRMVPVREWIDSKLEEVRTEVGFECDEIRTSIEWFNKSELGMWHHAHTHDNSFLSGIIYLTVSDSNTWFSVPSIWSKTHTLLNLVQADREHLIFKYPTTVGKMLVFPSGLPHSVSTHNMHAPRFSMSFNAFPSGLVGSKSNEHYRRFMHLSVNQTQD
jgi:hypothetical protein